MESKALRELTALYLDSVYDEGYKPYPKEKVDKQKDKAYKKEMIARGGKRTDAKDKKQTSNMKDVWLWMVIHLR